MTHICVGKLTNIDSDNGLSPERRQAIIWTNAGILLIGPLGTNFSEILIGIQIFSFKKMRLKMSSAKWPPFCLGHNVLRHLHKNILLIVEATRSKYTKPDANHSHLRCSNIYAWTTASSSLTAPWQNNTIFHSIPEFLQFISTALVKIYIMLINTAKSYCL